ncbi:DUF6314 family protein [Rhodobacteraceae bacterium XHP0102]|nr:DUF6314 family protein [Rhodobacteraceae bacterium XHP0102]
MRDVKLDQIAPLPDQDMLEGAWTVARLIHDHRAGQRGRFDGRAAFHAAGQGVLSYHEVGQLTYQGETFEAERRYIWRRVAAGWQVDFDDHRPFHLITAHDIPARHDCAPDLYMLRYDFAALPQRWHSHCRITGPRKDLDLMTDYSRA